MKKAIYLNIKSQFTKLIAIGEKNYEFRKYIPKIEIDKLFVYKTIPTCALKYIIELRKIIEYPQKIIKNGYGNQDFNNGLKKAKYAYEINSVYLIEKPISLAELKYDFTAPQSYAYDNRYPELTEYLNNCKVRKLI